jgi:hypothetical protein
VTFAFRLPMPPSTNMMFATDFKTRRRFRTKEYATWTREAGRLLLEQWNLAGQPRIVAPYALHIQLNLNHQSDVANREKAITDLLVATIPDCPDDRWINRILIERNRDQEAPAVVRVEAVL